MAKFVFLFPGQGSQFVGMGKELYDEFLVVKRTFEEASDILGIDLKKICFDGTFIELNKTVNMFTSILTVSIACYRAFSEIASIIPFCGIGHSLGEYSALTCSGALNFDDALRILTKRAELADNITSSGIGAMTVVNRINSKIVENECKIINDSGLTVSIACYNSNNQVTISGDSEAVFVLEDKLIELGAQVTPLIMSAPFHCSLMRPAAEELRIELKKYKFNKFKWPVISNVYALPYMTPDDIIKNLVSQMANPVQWQASIDFANKNDKSCFIELGPQSILTSLIKDNTVDANVYSFGAYADRYSLLDMLKSNFQEDISDTYYNIQKCGKENIELIKMCLVEAVSTRNRNFNLNEYQNGVIEAYEKIEEIQNFIEKNEGEVTREQLNEAIRLLVIIFETKKVPISEQTERLNDIINKSGMQQLFNIDMFIREKPYHSLILLRN